MKIIALDASTWRSPEDFYSALLPQLGAPDWHGRNLDALDDSLGGGGINSLEPPFKVEVGGADKLPETMRHFLSKVERVFADVRAETHKDNLIPTHLSGVCFPPIADISGVSAFDPLRTLEARTMGSWISFGG